MTCEDYVSFETAKLLKEQGFKIPYDSFRGVYINGIFKRLNPGDGYGYNTGDEIVEVCSLQMVMKWLREVHKLHIILDIHWLYFANQNGWMYTISRILENGNEYVDSRGDENDKNFYPTYEEAAEAGIKYCLEKLI